jgi:CheY-like chemotaxis protein
MPNRAEFRVLIVEDGAVDRMVYRIMLARRSSVALAITLAADGEAGLKALHGGTFDCMLLDHDLPDMTGLELLEQVASPDGKLPCPVVMVTGRSEPQIREEAKRRGVGAVLLKDELDDTRLRAAIDSVIGAPDAPAPAAVPASPSREREPARMLSIAEAKQALAATFGVSPASVEIIIHA